MTSEQLAHLTDAVVDAVLEVVLEIVNDKQET